MFVPTPQPSDMSGKPALFHWLTPNRHLLIVAGERLCAGLALLAAAYVAASTVFMVADYAPAITFWDQWDELILDPRQVSLSWLYSQHNEHRILFPRLIFLIDAWLFKADNTFNYFCNLAIPMLLALLVTAVAARELSRLSERIWVGGAVFTLLLSAMQWENFAWGFQVQFFLVELAAVASFAAIALGEPKPWKAAAAILCETVAVYSLSSGIIVPVIVIGLAVWLRRPKAQLIVLTVAAIALAASYLHGYATPDGHSDPWQFHHRLGAIAAYVAASIGNPFGRLVKPSGWMAQLPWAQAGGGVGICLLGLAAAMLLRRRPSIRGDQAIFLATAAYGVGTALLMALGRVGFGQEYALSARYSSPALLFWSVLGVIGFIAVVRRYPRRRLMAMGVGLGCLAPVVAAQPRFAGEGVQWVLTRQEATTALLADVTDQVAFGRIYPSVPRLLALAPELRSRHLSIYSETWSRWLDTPLAQHVRIGDRGGCRGVLDAVTPLPGAEPPAWRAVGWVWDDARDAAPRKIVLTDATGRVVGYGLSGFTPRSADMPRRKGWKRGGWHGHFAAAPETAIIAYALLDHDRVACPLAGRAAAH
jgi:hypothetical protein